MGQNQKGNGLAIAVMFMLFFMIAFVTNFAGSMAIIAKSQFEASKNFDSVKTQIAGLGEIDAIQQLYVAHTKAAMDAQ